MSWYYDSTPLSDREVDYAWDVYRKTGNLRPAAVHLGVLISDIELAFWRRLGENSPRRPSPMFES